MLLSSAAMQSMIVRGKIRQHQSASVIISKLNTKIARLRCFKSSGNLIPRRTFSFRCEKVFQWTWSPVSESFETARSTQTANVELFISETRNQRRSSFCRSLSLRYYQIRWRNFCVLVYSSRRKVANGAVYIDCVTKNDDLIKLYLKKLSFVISLRLTLFVTHVLFCNVIRERRLNPLCVVPQDFQCDLTAVQLHFALCWKNGMLIKMLISKPSAATWHLGFQDADFAECAIKATRKDDLFSNKGMDYIT